MPLEHSLSCLQKHANRPYLNTLVTGSTNLYFYGSAVVDRRDKFVLLRNARFESAIHWSSTTYLGVSCCVSSLSCLFMDIQYVTSLLSRLRLKEWHLFLKLSAWVSQKLVYYSTWSKTFEEEIISDLISDNLSDVPVDSVSDSDSDRDSQGDTERKHVTSECERGSKGSDDSASASNAGAITRVKVDKMPALGQSIWNPGMKQIPLDCTKVSDVTELLFWDSFFDLLFQETNRYYLQNREKYDRNYKALKWVDVTLLEMKKFFFAVNILMGHVRKAKLKDYWSTDPFFETPISESSWAVRDLNRIGGACISMIINFNNSQQTGFSKFSPY
jgi:hypothetical protein